jgi:hypothetical protein
MPQNAKKVKELCLRLTSVSTALPFLIENYCGRSIVFGATWFAAPAAKNESFVAASAASSLSAKNNGVLTRHVIRHSGY